MVIQLRPYQIDVLDRARAAMRNGKKRVIIQAATGAGKGRIIGEVGRCAHLNNKRFLILADRRKLISQVGGNLDDVNVPYGVIMSGQTKNTKANIILSTIQTLVEWINNPELGVGQFDGIIIDEAHKSMGDTYQAILALFPNAYVIGLTATPCRSDGKSLGNFWQHLECAVPVSKLVDDKWLIKPEVYQPPELAEKRKKGEKTKGLAGDPVTHWQRHAAGLPTIAFSRSVPESLELMEMFRKAGIAAEHVDANSSDIERDAKYERLRTGQTKVLCSVRLLIEGIDIPEVACAIIWCKMGSITDWLQSCGRIMRPVKCKETGLDLKQRAVVLDHSGASSVHPLPGEDFPWSLDEGTTIQQRLKQKKDKKSKTCPKCGCVSPGLTKSCPACGYVFGLKEVRQRAGAKSEAYDASDELLVRVTANQDVQIQRDAHQRQWFASINAARVRGGKASMACAIFHKKTGKWPNQCGVSPLPSSDQMYLPAVDVFVFKKRGS